MHVRGHFISCGVGLIAGALLVAGLALQPERGPGNPNRPGDRRPDQRPGDRPPGDRPGPGQEGLEGPDGPGRPPIDRDRAIRRLEERLKSLDKQKDLVGGILERLRKGESPERMGLELLEAMRGPGAPGGGNVPPNGGGNDREEMRRLVGEFDPQLVARMDDFGKRYPIGGRVLGNLMPKPQEIMRAKQEDKALFELYKTQIAGGLDVGEIAMSLHDLVRSGKEASDEGNAKKASLREALTKQFETRRKVQERDIESLTKRIDELKVRVSETAEQRAAAVEVHLERLTKQLREMKPRER